MAIWHPYDWQPSPWYELTYLWQAFTQINMGLFYGASDISILSFTVLLEQQFNILADNFQNNVNLALIQCGLSENRLLKFQKMLKNNIKHHT